MYRLNVDDRRLALPVAVYQIRNKQDGRNYLLRDGVEKAGKWDFVESIPFYAIEPARAYEELVHIYVHKIPGKNRQMRSSLTVKNPNPSAKPLFYALPPTDLGGENSSIVPLYEYRHADTEERFYSIQAQLGKKGWTRTEKPLCRVWKAPPDPLLLDSKAKPTGEY
jgi:hypothetical protein